MRSTWALVVAGIVLSGCSGGTTEVTDDPSGFEDLDVKASSTTGIILGVVVDEAIRPVKDVDVGLKLGDGSDKTTKSDTEGRFTFGNLAPGTYFLSAKRLNYESTQTSIEVVAGVSDPPVTRLQIKRLFSQEPFSELIKFDGYIACGYSFPVGSTCVNDYTRLIAFVPGCEGGCLRQYNVSRLGGNIREYVTTVGPGWQTMVFETTWDPSVEGTSPELTIVVSYFQRISTGHFFASLSAPDPMRLQVDLGEDPPGKQTADGEPEDIGPEGRPDLFVFYNNGGGAGSITVNQPFQSFHANFYYGVPPEGWSFVRGDQLPF